ncbi:chitobiase/beta-hexosaminidase C-terminal domain-containing protein [Candidatus Nephthysia bennettiae]|uniref:Chitobiase/beta-hexosaminidase C-terminal domain-containing protein n=1 Tax=Candidatus Nephthysia bennettiae TaxID=3127016 RepID=A0A934KEB7_9BACT|nr:chitobiase/beta-hexosaminidase C-terminal domain-containing protein [Candidatus Dormibacteraeota bacterium]MBJ7612122.1 chitobiase/beta-hexosaminidase C-terminal domain-containing protein [Candidatus Dormibacteraeota bacterium]
MGTDVRRFAPSGPVATPDPQGHTAVWKTSGGSPCDCGCDDACGLERVRFFPRQILGAEDLNTEQRYFKQKMRRHNRYLHGWGVVCGCEVKPAPTATKPYQVLICPGYVITPEGDEIMVGCPALYDLATCMVSSDDPCAFSRPCPPVTSSTPMRSRIYLTVCYKECEVRPVRVAPGGCSCDDAVCDYSRIRDAYEFSCLDSLPGSHQKPAYTCEQLCQGGILPCPPCPPDNCVVLATIRIDTQFRPAPPPRGVSEQTLTTQYLVAQNAPLRIDNLSDRRLLYSTEMLQAMALCQCGPQRLPVVDTPVINDLGTGGNDQVWVEITVANPAGSQIYYTTDQSDPSPTSPSSTLFGANNDNIPLSVGALPVTIKAIGVHPGYQDSAIASQVIPKQ